MEKYSNAEDFIELEITALILLFIVRFNSILISVYECLTSPHTHFHADAEFLVSDRNIQSQGYVQQIDLPAHEQRPLSR